MSFFRHFRRSKEDKYRAMVDATALSLISWSKIAALRIGRAQAENPQSDWMSKERQNILTIEIAYALIATICRDVFLASGGSNQARASIQDDLTRTMITDHLINLFDSYEEDSPSRTELIRILIDWYNLSELSYGSTIQWEIDLKQTQMDNSISGQCAARIAEAFGRAGDITLMLSMSMIMMQVSIEGNIPKLTVELIKAFTAYQK